MGDSTDNAGAGMETEKAVAKPAIGTEEVRKAYETLRAYKRGKQQLEDRIVKNEKWWRMRHWDLMDEKREDPKPASGWLFNSVVSKHADFMDAFPDSDILPRERGDVEEAQRLSSIIPVVMDQNGYRKVYSDEVWYKLKNGTGVFGVFWDQGKLNGLGDITIRSVDLLNLFWEPGITDIQKSRNLFCVELVDNDLLQEKYPQCVGKIGKNNDNIVKKYLYDETIDTSGKSAVIDWYYKKNVNGKLTLQYCKFVGDVVLYATENDTAQPTETEQKPVLDGKGKAVVDESGNPVMFQVEVPSGTPVSERGLYDHGQYPFVLDCLWPEAGMPVGFGLIDVNKNAQATIDIYNNAFEKNVQYICSPRYLVRNDGGINEEELRDPSKMVIHTDGNMGDDSMKPVSVPTMVNSNYISILDQKIDEMKETSGNHDVANGSAPSGVTAASSIAALQEASGKTSRDQISTTYDAHKAVVNLVIELIRQFYSMPRQFRIIGSDGKMNFVEYDNSRLQPQSQGTEFGVDMGYRLPVFDIRVEAEKRSSYSRLSQNELALQFYNSGFFNPQNADQAVACIDMMEFQGKTEVLEKIRANGGMYQQMLAMQKQLLQLSEMVDRLTGGQYGMAEQTAQNINAGMTGDVKTASAAMPKMDQSITGTEGEHGTAANARDRAAAATRPGQE